MQQPLHHSHHTLRFLRKPTKPVETVGIEPNFLGASEMCSRYTTVPFISQLHSWHTAQDLPPSSHVYFDLP